MKHAALVLLLAVLMALSPDAWARAGKGGSFGSRGSRTFDRPMERTVQPPQSPTPQATNPQGSQPMLNPNATRSPQAPMPAAAPGGFMQRNPFMAGMLGGLVGVGIGSLLFGHSPAMAAASDTAPFASMLGTFLQVALIGGGLWFLLRLFRRRQEATAGAPTYQRETAAAHGGPADRSHQPQVAVTPADQDEFARILIEVQTAWSQSDIARLRRIATPEVASWLSEDLADNAGKGLANTVEDVNLIKGDILESWNEQGRDYVTALLVFAARDYTVRIADGTVVEGDPSAIVEAEEAWTFVRPVGGTWMLTAIERA